MLPAWGKDTRIFYAHVHAPFQPETIRRYDKPRPGAKARPAVPERAYDLFRIPSLIDNHSYVVVDGVVEAKTLEKAAYIESRRPFSESGSTFRALLEAASGDVSRLTCQQRFLETIELERNAECFSKHQGGTRADCPKLADEFLRLKAEISAFCAAADQNTRWPLDDRCPSYPDRETWRCNLLLRGEAALDKIGELGAPALDAFARAQLAATKPKPSY